MHGVAAICASTSIRSGCTTARAVPDAGPGAGPGGAIAAVEKAFPLMDYRERDRMLTEQTARAQMCFSGLCGEKDCLDWACRHTYATLPPIKGAQDGEKNEEEEEREEKEKDEGEKEEEDRKEKLRGKETEGKDSFCTGTNNRGEKAGIRDGPFLVTLVDRLKEFQIGSVGRDGAAGRATEGIPDPQPSPHSAVSLLSRPAWAAAHTSIDGR